MNNHDRWASTSTTSDEDVRKMWHDKDPESTKRVQAAIAQIATSRARSANMNAIDTDDLIQNTTLRVLEGGLLKGGYKFKKPGFDAYVSRIAQNLIRDIWKSSRTRYEVLDDLEFGEIGDYAAPHSVTAIDRAVRSQNEADIEEKLMLLKDIFSKAEMEEDNQYCLVLMHTYKFSQKEIVKKYEERYGTPLTIGALKQRLLRAREVMKEAAEALLAEDETLLDLLA